VIKQTLRVALFATVLCGLVATSSVSPVFAATTAPAKAKTTPPNTSTNTLKISPIRTEVTIIAGQTSTVKTIVTNITGSPIVVEPIENDFVAGDENGTPALILDQNSYAPTHSLKRFMVPLKNVTINPGEAKEIPVTITVPKNAQAGGYFGAVRFAPANTSGSQQVNLSPSVASLILLTVPGPTTEQLNLTNFDIQQDGSSGSNFRTPENLQAFIRFENKGNVQQAPVGQINVKKGSKVVYTADFNQTDPKANVLPDSARRWTVPLKKLGKFGKYTVSATFTYGSKNESIDVTKTVWIVPTTYIYAGIIAIVVLVAIVGGFILFLKGYKRRLLGGSSRSGRGGRNNYRRR